jgi:hypothetical protein
MKGIDRSKALTKQPIEWEALDPALKQALSDFKSSVHAWSEAMYRRRRTAHEVLVRRTWRLVAGWVMASVLLAGAVSGGVYERHHRQELARISAARQAEQQRQKAADRAKEEEDLLARVDSDVSREVPSAMEPLASLMAGDETK